MKLIKLPRKTAVPNDIFMAQFPHHEQFEHNEPKPIAAPHVKPPHVVKPNNGRGGGGGSSPSRGLLDMHDDSVDTGDESAS
jgi:hypothetical protein